MNLFDLFVRVGVDDQASKQVATLSQKLGAGLKKAAAIGTAAVGAAAAGYVALTKNAINQYKEYEQLVGGVETLFADSAESVIENASRAFLTAGVSANQYMSTVTSFAASLKQSLGGDVVAAAELADLALRDMSDNANKMGTDIGMIQNAYSGFARQSYVMLDNLKLGYAGTRSEMRRLIRDAAALDDSIDANSMSFANIVRAINVVQTELGITGTTSKEAATTIEGSTAAAKAAWDNLAAGLADDEADIDALVKNFADSVVTAGRNLLPRVAQVGESVIDIAKNYGNVALNYFKSNAPVWWDKVQTYMEDELPDDIKAAEKFAANFINSVAEWIGTGEAIGDVLKFSANIGSAILSNSGPIIDASKNLAINLIDGMAAAVTDADVQTRIGVFFGNIFKTIYKIGEGITDVIYSLLDMTSGEYDEQFAKNAIEGNKKFFSGFVNFGKGFSSVIKELKADVPVTTTEPVVHEHNINMSFDQTGDEDIDGIIEEAAYQASALIQEKLNQRRAVTYGR